VTAVSDREQITGADAPATAGEFSRTGDPGEREPDSGMQLARALARHVKAALLHLRQAENIADAAGIDLDASEHGPPEAGLFRAAGDAAQDLDLWASCHACAPGATILRCQLTRRRTGQQYRVP
jgi:hypothetical protein